MNETIPKFLKRDKDSVIFNQDGELVFYIPEDYFDKSYAIVVGEYVNLLGLFNYAILDKNGKGKLSFFNFPSIFVSKPGSIEKVKNIKLTKNLPTQDYRLLKFSKGDTVIVSIKVPKAVVNAEEFFKMFTYGNIPTSIPYDERHVYFTDNLRLNGEDYGLNMQLFGILNAENCRSVTDQTKLFRHTDMNDMTNYQTLNIRQMAKYVSPFSAITSENWDEAVVNATLNKNEVYTPLEKLFTN